jgi:autotransporter-associated beta strand protein
MKDRPKFITQKIKTLFSIILFFTLGSFESYAQTPTIVCGGGGCTSITAVSDCGGSEYKATMTSTTFDYPAPDIAVGGSRVKCLGYTLSGCSYGGLWDCSSNSTWQISASSVGTQYIKVNTSTNVVTITTSDFACSSSNEKENNTTDLDDAGSWTSSVPTSSEAAIWESTVTGANSVALGSNIEFQSIEIQDPGGLVTITAGNTLTVGTDGIDMSAATQNMTLASAVALGSNQDWDVNTSKTLTASGVVSGAYKLSKLSAGTLTLSGTNTFTGGVDLDAGSLNIGAAAALGTTAGTLSITAGTTIDNSSGGSLTTSNYPLSINNFTFTGTNDLDFGTGATALASTSTITTSSNDLKIGGVISGSYAMAKSGAGTLTLYGANTFTSGITVNAGTLNIDNADALGAASGTLAISTGATIDNTSGGTITTSNYPITLNGSFTFTGTNNLNMGTGAVLLGGNLTITAAANDLTFGGVVSGAYDVTTAGSGNVYFTGESNSFTGQTDVGAGTVYFNTVKNVSAGASSLGSPASVGDGTITIGTTTNAGALIFNGSSDQSTDRVIDLAGTTGGATIDAGASNNLTFTSDFTATGGGDKTLSLLGSTSSNEIQGIIVDNSGSNITSVDKQGSGNWIFTGDNTYTGTTTITAGIIEVGSGGTSGTIASASIINGAALEFNRSDAVTYAGVISSSGTVTKKGGGTMTFTGGNTYTGNTTITAGNVQLGAAGVIADGSKMDMNGGGLITGSGAGFSETAGILDLSNSSIITLGTGDHTLTFAASNGEGWTAGKLLTINGWNGGYNGTAAGGSDPKIFVGSATTHLSASQLAQIGFYNGVYTYEADLLATGELVPKISLLPVELVHFAGYERDEMIDIEWVTASEINSDYFDVQRTGSQLIFESIGIVPAAGQSSSFIDYEFTDYDPEDGVNYYKLVEYDIDGTVQESKIIEVVSLEESTLTFLKTNGSGNAMFQLSSTEKSSGRLHVTSVNGQVVESSNILINEGGNQFILQTSIWQSGYYVMTIIADNLEPQSIKFLVK